MLRLLLLSLLAALLLACTSQQNLKSADIVMEIPWSVPETSTYRILQDDEIIGSAEMSIEEAEDGQLLLKQYFEFPDEGFVNDAEVIVDDQELQPVSTRFRIEGPEGDVNCEADYVGSEAIVHREYQDGELDEEIDVPQIAYDSWSDLFLWRTIEFVEGRDYEYTDVLSCTVAAPQRIGLKLEVKERRQITLHTGAADAWEVEIESGGETQTAWYSAEDDHHLLKYDNGQIIFELTGRS
jgi:hypothetical protein